MTTLKHGKTFQTYVALHNGTKYSVTKPLHAWDMNFHFIDNEGNDYLVDLQDVCDFVNKPGATLDDAITYANDAIDNGTQFYWMVR